jgi:hypothetical protein
MKSHFLFVLLIFVVTNTASAQKKNYLTAKVILKDGSILNGTIRFDNDKITPQQFELFRKENAQQKTLSLTPETTSTVEIADSIIFQSARIKIFTNYIDENELENTPTEPSNDGDFFLERMINGNLISLFILRDSLKTHFIIEDSSGNFQSLRYVRYIDNTNQGNIEKEIPTYKNQLSAFAINNQPALEKIMNSHFALSDISEAITLINSVNKFTKNENAEIKKIRIFFPFVEAGVGLAKINLSGYPIRVTEISFSPKLIEKFSLGVEFHFWKKDKFFAELYGSIYSYSFEGSNPNITSGGQHVVDNYEIKATPLSFGTILNYSVLQINKIRLSLGVGYTLVVNNIQKNSLTTTQTNSNGSIVILDQAVIGYTAGQYNFDADLFINRKISVRFFYAPSQDFSGLNFSSFKSTLLSCSIKWRL